MCEDKEEYDEDMQVREWFDNRIQAYKDGAAGVARMVKFEMTVAFGTYLEEMPEKLGPLLHQIEHILELDESRQMWNARRAFFMPDDYCLCGGRDDIVKWYKEHREKAETEKAAKRLAEIKE